MSDQRELCDNKLPQSVLDAIEVGIKLGPWTNRRQLALLAELALSQRKGGVDGSFCEFGVATGTSAVVLASVAEIMGRDLHLFDSFEGLPQPTGFDGVDAFAKIGHCKGSADEVRKAVGPKPFIHAGMFQNTLASLPRFQSIAFVNMDCDWYDSVKCVMSAIEPKLAHGAIFVFNPFWQGGRRAIQEWLHEKEMTANVIPWLNRWWWRYER